MDKNFTPVEVTSTIAYDAIPASLRGKTVSVKDMYGNIGKRMINDAKLHDANFAFLTTTLAKLNPELYEPLSNVTWKDDVFVDVGGGFVDYVNYYTVSYAGIANEMRNIVGNGANFIPRVNAGMTQMTANVYTFEIAYDLRFIELEKMKKLELKKSIEQIYASAIAVAWDFFCQKIAYTGGDNNHYGLFNHDDVVPTSTLDISKADVVDGSADFDTKIIGIINGIIATAIDASNMNPTVVPDTFLVPTWFATALSNKTNSLYTNSLYTFILNNNLALNAFGESGKIAILPRPQLNDAGVNGTGRIVAYKRDKRFVRMDMPYPIKHYITLPNIDKMAYTTAFVGQVSEVQLPYSDSNVNPASVVQYWDFIANSTASDNTDNGD